MSGRDDVGKCAQKDKSVENRVRRNIFILIGVSLLALIGIVLAWYFVFLRPQKETYAKLQQDLEARQGVASRQQEAITSQKKAQDRLAQLTGQLGFFRKRYRSLYFGELGSDYATETPLQRANRETAWRNWMNTYYSGLGPALSRELIAIADTTGVDINTAVYIQAPPKAPEEVLPPANGLLKPVTTSGGVTTGAASGSASAAPGAVAAGEGTISVDVTGSLDNILRFFDRLNTTQTLMNIGTVKLETASAVPTRIKATFTATPYLLSSGPGAIIAGGGTSSAASTTSTTTTSGTTTASTSTGGNAG